MQKKVEHAIFMNLTFDEQMQWYVGSMKVKGETVDICISAEDEDTFASNIRCMEDIYSRLESVENLAKDFATKELLSSKNSEWLADGEPEFTAETFRSRLELESVIVASADNVEFYFDDTGMFFDHAVLVTMHENDTFSEAEVVD